MNGFPINTAFMILSASLSATTVLADVETSSCSLSGGIKTSDKTLFTSFSSLLILDFVKSLCLTYFYSYCR